MTEQTAAAASGPDPAQLARLAALRTRRGRKPALSTSSTSGAVADSDGELARLRRAAQTEHRVSAAADPGSRRSPRRRPHPAQGGRIAAAGVGATGMLGLVAAFGLANPPETATLTAEPSVEPDTAATAPSDGSRLDVGAPSGSDDGVVLPVAGPASDPQAPSGPLPTPTPIRLTAIPVVRTIMVQPPPIVRTVAESATQPSAPSVSPGPSSASAAVAPAPAPAPTVRQEPPAPAATTAPARPRTSGSG